MSLLLSELSKAQDPINNKDNGISGDYNGSVTTAGSYDPITGNASRIIDEIVVAGSVGAYPLKWTRRLNSCARPHRFGLDSIGSAGGWSHSYEWQLSINHPDGPAPEPSPGQIVLPDGEIRYPDGRSAELPECWLTELIPAGNEGPYGRSDRFRRIDQSYDYELLLADGGVVKFHKPGASPVCIVTEIIDPYGLSTTFEYDGTLLRRIIEPGPIGQSGRRYLEITYSPGTHRISKVEANDGFGHVTQTVIYHHTSQTLTPGSENARWYLTQVDYDDTSHAHYVYQPSNISALYQNDQTALAEGLVESCDDPRFDGPMKKIKYQYKPRNSQLDGVIWGQIWKEKNEYNDTLSQLDNCSTSGCLGARRETRADGQNRFFGYEDYNHLVFVTTDFYGNPTRRRIFFSPTDNTDHCQITDARNNMVEQKRERNIGATLRVTYPDTSYVETIYTDPARPHYVASRRDENGHTTTYTRNGITHEVERIDYPDGSFETFHYNSFKQIDVHRMTNGGEEHFLYDARGLKTHYWPPETPSDQTPVQNSTECVYYSAANCSENNCSPEFYHRFDRLWKVKDPLGHITSYDYNSRGQVIRVTHDDNKFTQSAYNDDGTLVWTADENHPDASVRTQYLYDEYKRVKEVINPLGQSTLYDYTPPNGFGRLSHTTSSVYKVTPPGPSPKVTVYDYDWNFRRNMVKQAPGILGEEAITAYHYDEVGNLDWTEDPRGHRTTYLYNSRNRQTDVTLMVEGNPPPEATHFDYDFVGNKIRERRPDDAVRLWEYDAMNRLWYTYDWHLPPEGGSTISQIEPPTTLYGRDLAGNVHTITDRKGAVYVYEYDKLNRKIKCTYPADANNGSRYETWVYDIAGNLDRYKNPMHMIRRFHYDSRNRQDHSWWNGSVGPDIVTKYDFASRVTGVFANSGGQAALRGGVAPDDVTYAETKVYFGYDDANRKIWEDQILDGHTPRRIQTDLNPDGTRHNLQITSPDLGVQMDPLSIVEMPTSGPYFVTYDYTARNQLKSILGEDWSFNYEYDRSGNMTKRLADYNGQSSFIGCTIADYDARNRPPLWEQNSTGPGGTFARSYYQYDRANREVATEREDQNFLGDRFTYDPTNQLTSVAYNAQDVFSGHPQNATRTVTYAYTADKLNRSSTTDTPQSGTPVVTNYSASALNQYGNVGGIDYSYDHNFNLESASGLAATYDAANHLISAIGYDPVIGYIEVRFVYDGLGRCVEETAGVPGATNPVATLLIYDDWKALAEFDEWNYFQAWNVYGPGADEILLRYNAEGKYGYIRFHQDRHGNVAFLLDNDGQVVEKYTYDAFGRPKITDVHGQGEHHYSYYGHRFLFQGRDYFHRLGIYGYRNRFYHPALGRFLQTDPKGFDAGDMNLFRYCGDDPWNRSDPTGLEDIEISDEWNRLGIKASLNSRAAMEAMGNARRPTSQLVQRDADGKLALQPRINFSETENVMGFKDGRRTVVGKKHRETGVVDNGYTGAGSGHPHDDAHGFSEKLTDEDWAVARGKAAGGKNRAVKGQPVWKSLTSKGNRDKIERLTPQTTPGEEPTKQTLSATTGQEITAKSLEPPARELGDYTAFADGFDGSFHAQPR